MSDQTKVLASLVLFAASVVANAAAADDRVGAAQVAAPPLDGVATLVKLAGSSHALSQSASDQYVSQVPRFDADSTALAIAVLPAFQTPDAGTVFTALRHHIKGLAASLLQAPGFSASRLTATAPDLIASFHPRGVPYATVTLDYSFDQWATTQSATLVKGPGGVFGASLPAVPTQGTMVYALRLTGEDGSSFWYNNPRETATRQAIVENYFRDVGIVGAPLGTSVPVLALLLRGYTLPASLGGTSVTNDELSALVAQMTWEGQSGMDDPDAIDPALAELDALVAQGVPFNGVDTLIRNFLTQQRFRTASWSDGRFVRAADGSLTLRTSVAGVQSMQVYYATDAWNTPHVVTCAADKGTASCVLGDVAKGAYVAYAAVLTTSSGTSGVQAADGGNFFEKAP